MAISPYVICGAIAPFGAGVGGFEEASRQAKDCGTEALRHFSVAEFRNRLLSKNE